MSGERRSRIADEKLLRPIGTFCYLPCWENDQTFTVSDKRDHFRQNAFAEMESYMSYFVYACKTEGKMEFPA